jgi:hypothetical protein
MWRATIAATFFYAFFAPQIYWAILRIRDGAWGTRAPAEATEEPVEVVAHAPIPVTARVGAEVGT